MSENENRQELRGKLLSAGSIEEVRALLGPETAEEEIQQTGREIEAHRPADGLEAVDDDELNAVSGGFDRDYGAEGCAATVEEGSWCSENDKCYYWDVTYGNYDPCPKGGNHDWKKKKKTVLGITEVYFQCSKCNEEDHPENDRC